MVSHVIGIVAARAAVADMMATRHAITTVIRDDLMVVLLGLGSAKGPNVIIDLSAPPAIRDEVRRC
jgi:hypothetical protein